MYIYIAKNNLLIVYLEYDKFIQLSSLWFDGPGHKLYNKWGLATNSPHSRAVYAGNCEEFSAVASISLQTRTLQNGVQSEKWETTTVVYFKNIRVGMWSFVILK